MAWHFPTHLILSLFLAIASLVLVFLAWARRAITGSKTLVLLMAANAGWLVTYYFGLITTTPEAKLFWLQAQYPFILTVPAISLVFILVFIKAPQRLNDRRWLWLLVEPLLGSLLAVTNDAHHLVWSSVQFTTYEEYTYLETHYGPWSWFHLAFSAVLAVWGTYLLLRYARRAPSHLRSQSILLLVILLLAVTGVLLDLLAAPILHGVKFTSLLLLLGGMALVTLLDTRQSRTILPLARDAILENMRDAVIILDPHNHIIDLNHTASALMERKPAFVIGQPVEKVWAEWPAAADLPQDGAEVSFEVSLGMDHDLHWFDLRLSAILDKGGIFTGWLGVLRDITQRKLTEEALQRRDQILEAVSMAAEQFLKSSAWNENLKEVLSRLGEAAQVSRVYLFENVNDRGRLYDVLRHEWANSDTTPLAATEENSKEDLAASGYLRWVEDMSQGQAVFGRVCDFPETEQITLANEGVRSIAVVPIFVTQRWWGYIGFDDCRTERDWSSAEMDALRALAGTLGAAIERSQLYSQAMNDAAELTALYRASSQLLHPGRNLHNLAERITTSVVQEFASTVCSLRMLNQDTNCLDMLAQVGFPSGLYPPLPLDGTSVVATAARQGEAVYVPDVTQDPRYISFANSTRSQLACPLRVTGKVIGVLNLESPQLDGFDGRARRIFSNYADNAALAIQNVLLFNASEDHARRLARLNEITRIAMGSYGFKDTLKKLADNLVDIIGSDICFVNLWDPQQKVIIPGAASGSYHKTYLSSPTLPNNTTLTSAVMETGKPLFVSDLAQPEFVAQRLAALYPIQAALAVPMIAGRQKLGSIIFGFKDQRQLSDDEINVSTQFADQVGLAISKAWALEAAHLRAREADNLRQASAAINSSLELTQVLDSILVGLEPVVHYDSACIFLREGQQLKAVAERGLPASESWLHSKFPLDDLFLHTQELRKPLILRDAQEEALFQRWGGTSYVRGWMGVPLILREDVIGMLTMDSRQPDTFTLNHARLAAAFADQVAIAIENARLYQEARMAAERRLVLHRVSQEVVTASFDPEQIYTAIYRAASQLMPVDAFAITLVDEPANAIVAVYLIDRDQRSPVVSAARGQGLSSRVISSGQSLSLEDIEAIPDLGGIHFGSGQSTRSILAVPLRAGERVLGMLSAQSYAPRAYTTEDLHLLEMLASHAAIAIENTRLIKQVQWLAITDPLTGLYNRRGLFDLGQREVERYRRFAHPFAAIMIDIDLFKDVNDAYGHTTGDQVLVALANELRVNTRDVDVIGRYGGEEMVVLLPETDLDGGIIAAERLRQAVEVLSIPSEHGNIRVTISLGVAEFNANIPDLATLVDQADSVMYQAKQAGRNRVCAYNASFL